MSDKNKPKVDEQNHQPDNAGLQNKLTEKQSPADFDKAGLSDEQRANVSTSGAVDRQSVGEIGTSKHREKNRILNEQVKDKED
jgi:hypothetical protein